MVAMWMVMPPRMATSTMVGSDSVTVAAATRIMFTVTTTMMLVRLDPTEEAARTKALTIPLVAIVTVVKASTSPMLHVSPQLAV